MNLFSRKKQPLEPTGFAQFLESSKNGWITDYLDDRNEIREDVAFADMQEDSFISQYTMPKFKTLVANLYAEYLEVEKKISDEDLLTMQLINNTPINITIRRIKAKASGNNWSVRYLDRTIYYGKTLNEAYTKLIKNNDKIAKKFAGPAA